MANSKWIMSWDTSQPKWYETQNTFVRFNLIFHKPCAWKKSRCHTWIVCNYSSLNKKKIFLLKGMRTKINQRIFRIAHAMITTERERTNWNAEINNKLNLMRWLVFCFPLIAQCAYGQWLSYCTAVFPFKLNYYHFMYSSHLNIDQTVEYNLFRLYVFCFWLLVEQKKCVEYACMINERRIRCILFVVVFLFFIFARLRFLFNPICQLNEPRAHWFHLYKYIHIETHT